MGFVLDGKLELPQAVMFVALSGIRRRVMQTT